ncbi:MAG TPA: hypothetical protein VE863_07280 [Pyrinomonadaceae bacterium]|nr:hypothetical protein [Pyrinomonadaceae bacterium]
MRNRDRGNIWPVISVAAGAFFVLVVMPLILHRQNSGRMATVDPHVIIGDAVSDTTAGRNSPAYRWPDSEVPRTAERLRDATAVAIAATTYVTEAAITGNVPHDAGQILLGIAQRQLVPTEWLTQQPGVLQMPHATVHLRYSPATLSVEIVSVPNERRDGPAILIRIPDSENTTVGARYFESMQLDGIIYPNPFAPIPEIIASGWQPRLFKQGQIPSDERAQLDEWVKTAIPK